MSKIKKLYSVPEVCKETGKTRKELSILIPKLIRGFAERENHKITEDELSVIKTAIENSNSL